MSPRNHYANAYCLIFKTCLPHTGGSQHAIASAIDMHEHMSRAKSHCGRRGSSALLAVDGMYPWMNDLLPGRLVWAHGYSKDALFGEFIHSMRASYKHGTTGPVFVPNDMELLWVLMSNRPSFACIIETPPSRSRLNRRNVLKLPHQPYDEDDEVDYHW